MNGPLSDGNDNIVDIFVLSTSTADSPLQARYLEKLGYRTTFFSNAQSLFESLRSGKPNLLICDSVTLHDEAYDLCRAIKADYDLWVVPVIIVTSASNLSDLLHVLDCNADNFISSPYDPSYFSALIEGMLSTPVERPTPEQIKTQFKIQHDDHLFVVTADRRRLLEFLLSSFEIAVNRSGDIIQITSEKDNLQASLQEKEERVRDQARSIEALNGTLRQKEQEIGALSADVTAKERQIRDAADEIHELRDEIEKGKTHIAAAEEQVQRLTRETEDLSRKYTTETGDLSRQISTISEHLAATSADLRSAEESLALETSKKTETESLLQETTAGKAQAEKTVLALTGECEQMRASLAAEKERVLSLETDIKNLAEEKSGTEEKLRISIDTGAKDLADREERLNSAHAALEERDRDIASLKTEIAKITEARDGIAHDQETLLKEFGNLKDSLAKERAQRRADEERMTGEIREREAALQALQDEHQTARNERDGYQSDLNRVQSALDAARAKQAEAESTLATAVARIGNLETELGQASSSNKEVQEQVLTLKNELELVQAERDESRKHHLGAEAALADERLETERVARDLDAAMTARSNLENDLAGAQGRVRDLESGLKTAETAGARTENQVQALADELEQMKAELESSRRQRHTIEELLTGERLEKDQISSDLQRISKERESLATELAKEKQVRCDAEAERERLLELLNSAKSEGKDQENSLSATIRELTAELGSSHTLRRELETQVAALLRDKQLAEERVSNLSAEIDQARTALADEWEDHMNAQAAQQPGELESEKAKKRALIVKGPDLPMNIGKGPQSLSAVQTQDHVVVPAPRIRNVEDLFEDEDLPGENKTDDLPSVSIIQESSADVAEDASYPLDSENGIGSDMPVMDSDPDEQEPDEERDTEEDTAEIPGGNTPRSPGGDSGILQSPGISFNRAQWYDLLKWTHHSGTLTQEQRMQIVRMGRLIQKGRKLTRKQEEQVKEMLLLVQAQGYRFI